MERGNMRQPGNLPNGRQTETPRMMRTVIASAAIEDWDFGFY